MCALSAVFPGEASFCPSIQKCSGFCPEISGRAFCSFPSKAFAEWLFTIPEKDAILYRIRLLFTFNSRSFYYAADKKQEVTNR